ncbi:serine/threonine-protein kinase [Paraliomyxa miuraensis]|uniref:serine/threonine-protein kinase n=1 Tax=Paraliomyxa miuraensis TaxID=376150 RepID=UPI00225744AD|nr:serine/threonine-protein kinase [Paraliomyxa miuraensis]MCX4240349.1 serine/threonine-protein kinase [Paraliomyxa miuraensis]
MSEPSHPDAPTIHGFTLDRAWDVEPSAAMPRAIGPYVPLERLGEGGMGVVYRAHDPRLDRAVALKLLRADVSRSPTERGRQRMIREARAMANVVHPNVVEVFDVGEVDSQVFVAMELVEGRTLARWLREQSRTTAEILGVFVQAGRGLRAAHDKGLVHRDFKPDNVLVGNDGRVRVTDFGLARAVEGQGQGPHAESLDPHGTGPSDAGHGPSPHTLDGEPQLVTQDDDLGPITRTGIVLGTPAYMALEQHMGGSTDARTDQFAFCVALFEALAGHRPFSGTTSVELGRAKHAMRIRELPSRKGLRPAVRRAILRGLQADPSERWPSMAALLGQLDPPARVPQWAWLGLASAVVLAGGLAVVERSGGTGDRCQSGEARLARLWSTERQDALARAFSATGRSYAEDTWRRTHTKIDDYAEEWRATHRTLCEDHRPPDEGADGRMACLDRRLARLEGLIATLEEADPTLVDRAVSLASSLRSPLACLDPATAAGDEPTPPSPELAAAWERQEQAVVRVDLLLEVGRERRALEQARAVMAEADAADWPPLRAVALRALGTALESTDELEEAERILTEGYWLAHEHELDALAAQIAAQLVWLAGSRQLDEAKALQWARHSRTSIERRGGEPFAEAAIETALGAMYLGLGRPEPAQESYRRALALFREHMSDAQPSIALALSNLGAALAAAGDYEGSLEHQRAALELWTRALGEEHPSRADAIDNIALAEARLGRFEQAIVWQEQALALRRRTFDPDDLRIATSLNNLGAFEEARGDHAKAEAHHREALTLYQAALDEHDVRVIAALVNLGLVVLRRGQHEDARALAQRAVALLDSHAPEHPYLGHALVLLGSASRRAGDPGAAAAASERALALCEGHAVAVEPNVCLEATYELARALWPGDRALALAQRLRDQVRDAVGLEPALEQELSQWLAEVAPAPP